jgi:hypothetical protein
LVVGGGGDLLLDRERRQQGLDVCAAHRLGRACVVEEQIPCDPGDRRVLRMQGLVLESDGIADVVEPCLGTWFHGLYHLRAWDDPHTRLGCVPGDGLEDTRT